jgi:opacity protein-like surface antigen
MKKLVLATILMLGLSAIAMAQDVPMAEVFGGYSFARCNVGTDNECNFDGWNAAVDFNINKNWGIAVDVSGYYGSPDNVGLLDSKSHNFMFGPRYAFRTDRVVPFIQGLVGINHVNPAKIEMVQNNFAMAFGGGIDIKVNDRLSIRPIQMDYFTVRVVSTGWSDNFRFSTGLVFKFGKR